MYKNIALILHLALVLASAQTGGPGNALSFDGTTGDYVIHNPFNNFPSNAITIEFWMRTSDTTKAGTPISYATSAQDNMLFIHDYRDLRFRLDGTAIPASGGTGVAVNNGQWHHVAVMWRNSGLFILYVDGVQRYSANTIKPGFLIPSGGALVIGQEQDSRGGGFQAAEAFLGTIDELRIWNVQRTETQIRAGMHRSWADNNTGLVLYYRMDETSTGLLTDSTSHDHTGSIAGATRVTSTAPIGNFPFAETMDASNITATSAQFHGNVDPNGLATVGYFEWGTSSSSFPNKTPFVNLGSGSSPVSFSRVQTLQPSTTYYYHAVGSNVVGMHFGATRSFSTMGPPTVRYRAATQVTTDRALLWATFNPYGSPISFYFEYGTTTNYGFRTDTADWNSLGFQDIGLGHYVSNLLAETTYHYRGIASNSFGVIYGPDGTFVTQIFGEAASFRFIDYTHVDWGDYDNDGDLDLIATGTQDGYLDRPHTALWRNTEGIFSHVAVSAPQVGDGMSRWGDFDNDGWLDLFVMGSTNNSQRVSDIRRNNGNGTFSSINPGLRGVSRGAAAWGDYDNDGDLDLIMTGTTNGQPNGSISQILRNNGDRTFSTAQSLIGLSRSAVAWGDFEHDGDLELVIAGQAQDGSLYTVYYRNVNGALIPINVNIPGVRDGSVAWGDYDNDGDLDLIVSGTTDVSGAASGGITQIWRNDGNVALRLADISLPGVSGGAVAWGDYDNDGDLDLALTGLQTNSVPMTQLYSNEGNGTFASLNLSIPGVQRGSLAWADYDNDGDIDLALTGTNQVREQISQIRRNDSFPANSVPDAPSNLGVSFTSTNVMLSWNAAGDAQTPSSVLTYNVHVTPAVSAAQADLATGYRRVAAMGNVQQGTNATLILSNYPSGTYYWTVQAIDSAFAGGPFAPTNILELAGRPHITPMPPINLTPNSATLQATVNPGGRNTSASFDLGTTTAYGTQLGMTSIGNEFLNILVAADAEGLSADIVYHYRATAFNVFGPATGADVSFRTPFFSVQPQAIEVALAPGAATNVVIALSNHIASAVNVTNRFVAPPPAYAAVMNPTLTLAANGKANVNLLIDATGLVPAIYEATIEIVSGATHAVVQIPVQLTVIAAESAQINSVSLQPSGSMLLDFAGTSGYAQTVFASTNLEDWIAIGPATQISPGRFQFTDPAATNFTQRFYKIRTP